jgi:hypothetical protein
VVYSKRKPVGSRNLAIAADRAVPGSFAICEDEPNIVALFSQWRPGKVLSPYFSVYPESDPPETAAQRLEWFRSSLSAFGASLPDDRVSSIAVPYRIGCGLAGGDWKQYRAALAEFQDKCADSAMVTLYKLGN